MENKNITYNLSIQQANKSNVLAYNKEYVSANIDTTFGILLIKTLENSTLN